MSFTLCSNQLYPHNHYLLSFYPAFITFTDCFIVINIVIIIIIIKINPPFSLSTLLKFWLSPQLLCTQDLNQLSQLRRSEMISNNWFVGSTVTLPWEWHTRLQVVHRSIIRSILIICKFPSSWRRIFRKLLWFISRMEFLRIKNFLRLRGH